jgi:site-specific DNA-methyltransferase (adenine-specific)
MTTQTPTQLTLTQSDAIEWLKTLPDRSVDLIVTDPAYASLEEHRARGTTPKLTNWFPVVQNEYFPAFFVECFRVLKADRHLYLICDATTMFLVKDVAIGAGFRFWKPIVWNKISIGMGYHWRAQCEFVLFFEKGKRKLNDLSLSDVRPYRRIDKSYPTEKPVGLLQDLIGNSSHPGELVIDPFMGSGSTGCAALNLGRRFAGCDIEPRALQWAHDRLARRAA